MGSLEQVWHLAGSSRPPQQLGVWVGGRCSHQRADPVPCRAPSGPEKQKTQLLLTPVSGRGNVTGTDLATFTDFFKKYQRHIYTIYIVLLI